jgi:hypothetical protein
MPLDEDAAENAPPVPDQGSGCSEPTAPQVDDRPRPWPHDGVVRVR